MDAQKLWHYLAVIFVVVAIVGLSIKHIFIDESKWEQVSGQSLHNNLQTHLAQVYWQWQQEGRPSFIVYKPQNALRGKTINMDSTGSLQFAHSEEGCKELLTWFVEQKALHLQVQVSTTMYGQNSQSEQRFACQFKYASYVYLYLADTRELTFTQVE